MRFPIMLIVGLMLLMTACKPQKDASEKSATPPRLTINADWTPVSQLFDGVEMVLVPAGCFQMGSVVENAGKVCFDEAFWLDRYEATNAQFAQFGGMAEFSSMHHGANQPREQLSWFEAHAYCNKHGGRLPSEAEWEYAARGLDGLTYPWGNEYIPENVVFYGEDVAGETAEVGSKPSGMSWVGAYDMSGNVFEWTNTLHRDYPYNATDGRENDDDTTGSRVVRGGSINYGLDGLETTYRGEAEPNLAENYLIGVRCVRSES